MLVGRALWDSWSGDAVLNDRRSARPNWIRAVNHAGLNYRISRKRSIGWITCTSRNIAGLPKYPASRSNTSSV